MSLRKNFLFGLNKYIIILLLISGIGAMGQSKYPYLMGNSNHADAKYGLYGSKGKIAIWILDADTLEIALPAKIHFIRIGSNVYRISDNSIDGVDIAQRLIIGKGTLVILREDGKIETRLDTARVYHCPGQSVKNY